MKRIEAFGITAYYNTDTTEIKIQDTTLTVREWEELLKSSDNRFDNRIKVFAAFLMAKEAIKLEKTSVGKLNLMRLAGGENDDINNKFYDKIVKRKEKRNVNKKQ